MRTEAHPVGPVDICVGKVREALRRNPPECHAAISAIQAFEADLPLTPDETITDDSPISALNIDTRTHNFLDDRGIDTVFELQRISRQRMLSWKWFGDTGIKEVERALRQAGRKLLEDEQ